MSHSSMASGTSSWLFVYAALSFCFFIVTDSQTDHCLACSYNFAGDGTTDLECVTNATYYHSTRQVPCNFAIESCATIAVYTANYGRLSSLARNCQTSPGGVTKKPCDDLSTPSCRRFCKADLCNKENGDIHATLKTGDDGKNGVASLGLQSGTVWLLFSGIFFACL